MSPTCRTELESALASQGQISMDCRVEIQTAFQTLGVDLQHPTEEEAAQMEDNTPRQARAPPSPDTPKDSTTPILAIAGFVVALFAGAGAFVMYKQSQMDPDSIRKPKKLSKKKVSKDHDVVKLCDPMS